MKCYQWYRLLSKCSNILLRCAGYLQLNKSFLVEAERSLGSGELVHSVFFPKQKDRKRVSWTVRDERIMKLKTNCIQI